MSLLGNLLWLIFGGIFVFLHYLVAGFLMCITIIGIPFGIQVLKLARLSLMPFGKEIVNRPKASGCLSLVMNIIWLLIGGLPIALHHLVWALLLAITIIGIPFAMQHVKLAGLALTPFGKEVI